jgi:UDP-N-acetylglucosamine 4-epimerase
VVGLDNLSTGFERNLHQVRGAVGERRWANFRFQHGDIRDPGDCREACRSVHTVLHQAALGSVQRSMEDPIEVHQCNVTGFLHMLIAARDAGVSRFVYASSSAIYGDHPALPKVEASIGQSLSPYAATKHIDELYAQVCARCYGIETVGLRYFNVFGPRQDPGGAYAAVIPRWISALIHDEPVYVFGDGETTRDFCYIENAVQANLLAATVAEPAALNQAYNVAVNERTSLNALFEMLRGMLEPAFPHVRGRAPEYRDFRAGDMRHSLADIEKAQALLGYAPGWHVRQGLAEAIDWYVADEAARRPASMRRAGRHEPAVTELQ